MTCLVEADWTVKSLWVLGLLTIGPLIQAGHDPLRWSVARSRDAVRVGLRDPLARPRPRERVRRYRHTLAHLLREAHVDGYERKRPEAGPELPAKEAGEATGDAQTEAGHQGAHPTGTTGWNHEGSQIVGGVGCHPRARRVHSPIDSRITSLPARLCPLKPNVPRQPGSRGSHPPAAGERFDEEPSYVSGDRFVEPALRTHRSLCNPRGLVRGHPARYPRLGTCSFRHLSTAEASGGHEGFAPLHPPPGCPWTR